MSRDSTVDSWVRFVVFGTSVGSYVSQERVELGRRNHLEQFVIF